MKVYKGTMYKIIVERTCGCKATQEYKDALMKEADGDPAYKPCAKHKRGQVGDLIQELLFEVILKEAEDHQKSQTIAIAEANATKRETAPPAASVGEGSESEARTAIKVGNKVVQRPKQVGASPLRRAAAASGGASTQAQVLAAKKAEIKQAATPGNSIDAELAGDPQQSQEDPRITRYLVDDADGGLLGAEENDPSAEPENRRAAS